MTTPEEAMAVMKRAEQIAQKMAAMLDQVKVEDAIMGLIQTTAIIVVANAKSEHGANEVAKGAADHLIATVAQLNTISPRRASH